MNFSEKCIVFFGDLRGTKSALQAIEAGGNEELQFRIASLQNCFSSCFLQYVNRSRSLTAVTLSDSVLVQWSDYFEGLRFSASFAQSLWKMLDHTRLSFRGYLDSGFSVQETDAASRIIDHPRFQHTMPTSVALWSVAMAESASFPEGIFVGETLANEIGTGSYESDVFQTKGFRYRKLRI